MNLDKNTIRAIGLLAFIGIFAASGFLVVKPQIEEGFDLMSQTTDSVNATDMRELRLLKLKTQNENMDALKNEVNQMLELVPSKKDVTNIAGAVIQAMPAGVQLVKFSHGEVVDGGPAYSVPTSSLTQPTAPFELVVPGEKPAAKNSDSKEDETKAAPVKKDPNNISAFVTAPFILEVKASGLESLNDYLDRLQNQDRLISVAAVTSNENNGELTATIYGYAFAGSTPEIKTWENPPTDETPAN